MNKSLLRFLEIVSVILVSVSFDLSSFAPELVKKFCTSLRIKDDTETTIQMHLLQFPKTVAEGFSSVQQ